MLGRVPLSSSMKQNLLSQRTGARFFGLVIIGVLIVVFAVVGIAVGARSIELPVLWNALTDYDAGARGDRYFGSC